MRKTPFPSIEEAFAEVRREDTRPRLMLNRLDENKEIEGSVALITNRQKPSNCQLKGVGVTIVNAMVAPTQCVGRSMGNSQTGPQRKQWIRRVITQRRLIPGVSGKQPS
ncbi:hypothetical protein LIER_13154 [Lithospermum erythrorhizon]|uniref:Uncharacterized protein n=1 Tax=Lithospermum erythrorhizon TaxID=34254 RepID=A0AAV3PXP2_LITER